MEKIESNSQFYNHAVRVKENIILDDVTTGEDLDSNIIVESATLIVNAGIALTVGEGKTLIPDLYNVLDQTAK